MIIPTNSHSVEVLLSEKGIPTIKPTPMKRKDGEKRQADRGGKKRSSYYKAIKRLTLTL